MVERDGSVEGSFNLEGCCFYWVGWQWETGRSVQSFVLMECYVKIYVAWFWFGVCTMVRMLEGYLFILLFVLGHWKLSLVYPASPDQALWSSSDPERPSSIIWRQCKFAYAYRTRSWPIRENRHVRWMILMHTSFCMLMKTDSDSLHFVRWRRLLRPSLGYQVCWNALQREIHEFNSISSLLA